MVGIAMALVGPPPPFIALPPPPLGPPLPLGPGPSWMRTQWLRPHTASTGSSIVASDSVNVLRGDHVRW